MLDEIAGVVRAVAAVPLVLFLPGHAITLAVGWAGDDDTGRLERLTWAVGLSMAVAALGAFGLNVVPGGLTSSSWLVFLCAVTGAAAVVAELRQRRDARRGVRPGDDGPGDAGHSTSTGAGAGGRSLLRHRATASFAAAAVLVVGAAVVARQSAVQAPSPGFTQLYLVPQSSGPKAQPTWAILGVHSYEGDDQGYRLVLRRDGYETQRWSIRLRPDGVSDRRVELPRNQVVEALLYRADDPAVYRHVQLRTAP
jgi:hypothetical protein